MVEGKRHAPSVGVTVSPVTAALPFKNKGVRDQCRRYFPRGQIAETGIVKAHTLTATAVLSET